MIYIVYICYLPEFWVKSSRVILYFNQKKYLEISGNVKFFKMAAGRLNKKRNSANPVQCACYSWTFTDKTKFGYLFWRERKMSRISVALYRNRPYSSSYSLLVLVRRASTDEEEALDQSPAGFKSSRRHIFTWPVYLNA